MQTHVNLLVYLGIRQYSSWARNIELYKGCAVHIYRLTGTERAYMLFRAYNCSTDTCNVPRGLSVYLCTESLTDKLAGITYTYILKTYDYSFVRKCFKITEYNNSTLMISQTRKLSSTLFT